MQETTHAAVLFADVSGSARLYECVGDALAFAAIRGCLDMLGKKAEAAGGRVVKIIGDRIMAAFLTADAASDAAVEMQKEVAELPAVGGAQMGIRVGFNFGPVVEKDGDIFGDTVNLAARLSDQAQKDQIITSQATVESMSTETKASCRQLYAIKLRGKEQGVDLWQVMWQQSSHMTAMVGQLAAPGQQIEATLRLKYRGTEVVMKGARRSISLGRDRTADLPIVDPSASRDHCVIERRADLFVLADHSSNGTYVTVEGDRELLVRRDEVTLSRNGWISLGHPRDSSGHVVEFSCE